jgi:hypothetical protein
MLTNRFHVLRRRIHRKGRSSSAAGISSRSECQFMRDQEQVIEANGDQDELACTCDDSPIFNSCDIDYYPLYTFVGLNIASLRVKSTLQPIEPPASPS